ncbi:MAG: hypothetical protein ACLGIN_09120 [Candidatus Sericytochromatia bacterium]
MCHRPLLWLRPLLALSLVGAVGCSPLPPTVQPATEEAQPLTPSNESASSPAPAVEGAITFTGQATLGGQPLAAAEVAVLDPVTRQPLPVGSAPAGKPYLLEAPGPTTAEGTYTARVAGLPGGRAVLIVAKGEAQSVSGVFLGPRSEAAGYRVRAVSERSRLDEVTSLNAALVDGLLITAALLTPAAAEPVIYDALGLMGAYRVLMGAALVRQPALLKMVTDVDAIFDARRQSRAPMNDMLTDTALRRSMTKVVVERMQTLAQLISTRLYMETSVEEVLDYVTRIEYPGTDLVGRINFETWTVTMENPKLGREVDLTKDPKGLERIAPTQSGGGDDSPSKPAATPTPAPKVTAGQLDGIDGRVYESLLATDSLQPADWDGAATEAVDLAVSASGDESHLTLKYQDNSFWRTFQFNADKVMFKATKLYVPSYDEGLTTVTPVSGASSATGGFTLDGATLVMNFSGTGIETTTLYFDNNGLLALIMPAPDNKYRVIRWTGDLKVD